MPIPFGVPTPDQPALLCERCGYVIDGLDEGAACPECGLPVDESSPDRRPGSPWQRRPDYCGWLRTLRDIHTRPRRLFRSLRVAPAIDTRLQVVNQLLLPVTLVPGFWLLLRRGPELIFPLDGFLFSMLFASMTVPVTLLLGWIEKRGVIFFAAKRGWRVPEPLARSIIDHCSLTWFWAWYGLILGVFFSPLLDRALSKVATNTVLDAFVPVAPPLLGFVVGMLVFETLVYLGVRQCQYANTSVRASTDSRSPSSASTMNTP